MGGCPSTPALWLATGSKMLRVMERIEVNRTLAVRDSLGIQSSRVGILARGLRVPSSPLASLTLAPAPTHPASLAYHLRSLWASMSVRTGIRYGNISSSSLFWCNKNPWGLQIPSGVGRN